MPPIPRVFPRCNGLSAIVIAALTLTVSCAPSAPPRSPAKESPRALVEQLARVLAEVERDYVDVVDRATLLQGAIKGMVAELDPHSGYMPREEYELFQSETEGRFAGIGIEVDARADGIRVLAPIDDSPAQRAGILSGDRIVSIDGHDVTRSTLDKWIRTMRGAPGSHVRLKIVREGKKEPLVFDLVRQIIQVPSVASRMLERGIVYLRVKQFQERTHAEFVAQATLLREKHGAPNAVLLDLRNNAGGLVDEASWIADEFLDSGTIYTSRHRGEVIEEVVASRGGLFAKTPLVVLVNEWSASASELVAGALADHGRAKLVGAHTFGKGSVQAILPLENGAGMRLTIARYYTPKGRAIQARGLEPDILSPKGRGKSLRESDLEGHLPEEGAPPTTETKEEPDSKPIPTVLDKAMGKDARTVPSDPSAGTDEALKVAYDLLVRGLAGER